MQTTRAMSESDLRGRIKQILGSLNARGEDRYCLDCRTNRARRPQRSECRADPEVAELWLAKRRLERLQQRGVSGTS